MSAKAKLAALKAEEAAAEAKANADAASNSVVLDELNQEATKLSTALHESNDTNMPLGISDQEQFEIDRAEAKKLRELKKRKRHEDECHNITTPVKSENVSTVPANTTLMVVQRFTFYEKATNVIIGNAAFAKSRLEGTVHYNSALCIFVYNKCIHFSTLRYLLYNKVRKRNVS
jgi:seryl-tRNA synthetase